MTDTTISMLIAACLCGFFFLKRSLRSTWSSSSETAMPVERRKRLLAQLIRVKNSFCVLEAQHRFVILAA